MSDGILDENQIKLLKAVGADPALSKCFYLTGGTALAGFYIPYRLELFNTEC